VKSAEKHRTVSTLIVEFLKVVTLFDLNIVNESVMQEHVGVVLASAALITLLANQI